MKKNQSGSVLIAVVVIIALIVLSTLGFFLWRNTTRTNEPVITTPGSNQENNIDQSIDPYTKWKTYSSSRDGYSIKYPSDWIAISEKENDGPYIRNMEPNGGGYPDGYINLRVLKYTSDSFGDMTATEWYNALGNSSVTMGPFTFAPDTVKALIVNSMDGKRSKASFSEVNEVIFLLHDGSLYEINLYPYGATDNSQVKKMLDSFSFS